LAKELDEWAERNAEARNAELARTTDAVRAERADDINPITAEFNALAERAGALVPIVEEYQTLSNSQALVACAEREIAPIAAQMRLVKVIDGTGQGERDSLAYWACRAGEMVTSGLLGADAAAAMIAKAAARAGSPRSETERTAWSGIRATRGLTRA
jgi:hypothetical protein